MAATNDLRCPHCSARVERHWKECWLCGLALTGPAPAQVPSARVAASGGPSGSIAMVVRMAGGLIALALAFVVIGLVADGQYGGVFALGLLLLPAGLVTLAKSLKRSSGGTAMTGLEKLGTFLLSLAVTVGAIVALGVAAFVALFIACIAMIASDGMNFR